MLGNAHNKSALFCASSVCDVEAALKGLTASEGIHREAKTMS